MTKLSLTPSEQKILEYLQTHKTPVAASTMAKRFIISQSKAGHALALLQKHGLAVSFNVGNTKFYKINPTPPERQT